MTVDARFCTRCSAPLPHVPPVVCDGWVRAVGQSRPTGTVIIVDDEVLGAQASPSATKVGGICRAALLRRPKLPADAAVREAREELGIGVRLDPVCHVHGNTSIRTAPAGLTVSGSPPLWRARSGSTRKGTELVGRVAGPTGHGVRHHGPGAPRGAVVFGRKSGGEVEGS
jgi:hypothetical protein